MWLCDAEVVDIQIFGVTLDFAVCKAVCHHIMLGVDARKQGGQLILPLVVGRIPALPCVRYFRLKDLLKRWISVQLKR